jgi:phage terminase large subunit
MPTIQIPQKLYRVLTTKARIIVLLGGRGSAKSESAARILLMRCQTEAADILCGREYQNSIDDSVHKLLKGLIGRMGLAGFDVTEQKINCGTGGGFRFRGFSRNPEAVKSAQDFKYAWNEEAQTLSQESIDNLLPTIRAAGSQLIFTANPGSSADPFSKRFIVPFWAQLQAVGYYEDDMHLVIMINWRDNPWFPPELEAQRQWDFAHLPRAKYDHIWEGEFNDSIEDALILAEWFDACVDAHKTLGFKPEGIRFAAHDPSDTGPDNKGWAMRHGSVLVGLEEMDHGDINEGGDWATGLSLSRGVDAFTWDCDGMGVGLNRQVTTAFNGKNKIVAMFRGSEGVDNPDAIFEPAEKAAVQDQKTNADALKNKRAQYYHQLRQRIYRTYRAVEHKEYHDPDTLLSFDGGLALLPKLRSELCRMPVKPNGNGKFELYTKQEMKSKFKVDSPNLGDPVMMLMRTPYQPVNAQTVKRPPVLRPHGAQSIGSRR